MTIPAKKIAVLPQKDANPLQLLNQAVASGNVELAKQLMDLYERWEHNQGRKAFDNAMAAAKAEMPAIIKDQSVDFATQKGRTNYKYEDLSTLTKIVDPILAKHGLFCRYQTASDDKTVTVTCIISHRDGYFVETPLTGPLDHSGNKNPIQAIGSAVTYLQRYTLKAALGLSASKDDDARSVGSEPEPEMIMQDQIDYIERLIAEKGGERAGELKESTLKYFGNIADFSELPVTNYNRCVAAINKVKK